MQKTALRVAGFLFSLVALLHLVRAYKCIAIYVGQTLIPISVSWVGAAVLLVLAFWMFKASLTKK